MSSIQSDIHEQAELLFSCYEAGELDESNAYGLIEGVLQIRSESKPSLVGRLWSYLRSNEDLAKMQVKTLQELCLSKLAAFYHENPSALMRALTQFEGDPERRPLIEKIAEKVLYRIRLTRNYRGFIWSIANKERHVGYLVATLRSVDKDFAECEAALEALRESHLVFGQRALWQIEWLLSRGRSSDAMHDAYMKSAYEMGKQFLFLEPRSYLPRFEEDIPPEKLAPLAAALTAGKFQEFEKMALDLLSEEKLHTFSERNEKYLRELPTPNHALLQAFLFDRVITTVFIDALHCVGERSLITLLEKEGYTLTRKSF